MNNYQKLHAFWKSVIILGLATLVALVFEDMGIRVENIIMLYLLAVLLIVMETKSFKAAIISCIISVLTFNFCFTNPKLTFMMDDPNYYVTILIFLIVAFLASSLLSKLQMHTEAAKRSEKQTNSLFQMAKGYLNLSGIDEIIYRHIRDLYTYQGMISVIYFYDEDTKKLVEYRDAKLTLPNTLQIEMVNWCFEHHSECGKGTMFYKDSEWLYRPLSKGRHHIGVCAIYRGMGESMDDKEEKLFLETMISQLVMAIEREQLYYEQENAKVEIEKEKLRNQLLRSLSHDLRTPLTAIAGSSSLILSQYHELDDDTIYQLVKDIDEDANWLNALVENLLNMTRIQEGRLLLNRQKEVVDDILCEVNARALRIIKQHALQIHMPSEVLLVEMDGRLMIQVLLNLIDNACKHTQDDSKIDVYVYNECGQIRFEVCDNGPGIQPELQDHLFDSFVTSGGTASDAKRGIGLGLSIAKAIVEAHGGTIYGKNREEGGAVFGFTLPKTKEQ